MVLYVGAELDPTLKVIKKKKSGIRPFNLALNATLAYGYIYSGGMRFFFPGEYKLKINKWCLHRRCLYYMYFLLKVTVGFKNV